MHEMLTFLTSVCDVSLSVTQLKSAAAHEVYAACHVYGSFGAAFVKCFWPLVCHCVFELLLY